MNAYPESIHATPSNFHPMSSTMNAKRRINAGTCPEHEDETITNFCLNPECIKPLCPVCLEIHSQEHLNKKTIPQIQCIKTVAVNCLRKTKTAINELNQEMEKNQMQYMLNPKGLIEENSRALAVSKERLIRMIENYYEEMNETFRRKVQENSIKAGDLSHAFDKIRKVIEELNYLNQEISKSQEENYFRTLENVLRLDVIEMKKSMISEVRKVTDFRHMDSVRLKLEEHNFAKIHTAIERYCRIEIEGDDNRIKNNNNDAGNSVEGLARGPHARNASLTNFNAQYYDLNTFTPVVKNPGEIFKETRQGSPTTEQRQNRYQDEQMLRSRPKRGPLPITQGNYFSAEAFELVVKGVGKGPFLHFFQNNEAYLHLLPITNLREGKFKSIQIKNNVVVPPFHKSIMSPSGRLFLTGGTHLRRIGPAEMSQSHQGMPTNSTESLKSPYLYEFNFNTLTLEMIAELKYPRSSHSVCYLEPFLFIICGITNGNRYLRSCEKFNIETSEFEAMQPCSIATICSSVCSFREKHIYKIGGIGEDGNLSHYIERYDVFSNSWSTIDPIFKNSHPQQIFQMLSTSASLQINETDIFVFGGYYGDDRSSRQSFVLRVDKYGKLNETHIITDPFEYDLPFEEGFWNNTPIVMYKKVFALQNYEDQRTRNCVESTRRILVFNSYEWESFN